MPLRHLRRIGALGALAAALLVPSIATATPAAAAASTVYLGSCSATYNLVIGTYGATAWTQTDLSYCRVALYVTCTGDNGQRETWDGRNAPVLAGRSGTWLNGVWTSCTSTHYLENLRENTQTSVQRTAP